MGRRRDHLIAGFIERLPDTLELPVTASSGDPPVVQEPARHHPLGLWNRLRRRLGR